MSIFQALKMPDQMGESLLVLKVADFFEFVCSKCEGDTERTVDVFIQMLVQLLFGYAELFPSRKVQLNRIIRVLIDCGVQFRSNYHANKSVINESDISELINRKKNQKQAYSMLQDLDKKINEIQNKKKEIYNELFGNELLIDNVKKEVADGSFDDIEANEAFHPTSASKLAQLSRNTETVKNVDTHQLSHLLPKKSSNPHIPDVPQHTIVTEPMVNFVTMENLSSPVICFKVYDDVCMAGCENGELQIFNLEFGHMIDRIQAHSLPVTSLVIWNDIIITCSYDKTLKSFNLIKNSTKHISIEHLIETSTDDLNGVLYAGTSTGKICRFNMLSLTQIGTMMHVSSSKILCMKLFHHSFQLLIAVSAENKPIAIRNAKTGTLLKTLHLKNISFDISMQDNSWYGISKDAIFYMSFNNGGMKSVSCSNLSKICIYGNQVVVCGSEGNVYIYNKELTQGQKWTNGLKDDVTGIAIWKHFAIISYKHTKAMKKLNLLQT